MSPEGTVFVAGGAAVVAGVFECAGAAGLPPATAGGGGMNAGRGRALALPFVFAVCAGDDGSDDGVSVGIGATFVAPGGAGSVAAGSGAVDAGFAPG